MTKQQIGLYATILCDEVAIAAFTDGSLKDVAAKHSFFPPFAAVKTSLNEWLSDHPVAPRIGTTVSDSLQRRINELQDSQDHRDRLADRALAIKDDWSDPAKIRMSLNKIGDDHPMRDLMCKVLAGLIRKHAPQNLGYMPPGFQ